MNRLSDVGIPANDIGVYIVKNIDFDRVLDLRARDIPASDIRYYVDRGISLKNVQRLEKMGWSPKQIKWFALGVRAGGDMNDMIKSGKSFYGWCKMESSHSKHCPV